MYILFACKKPAPRHQNRTGPRFARTSLRSDLASLGPPYNPPNPLPPPPGVQNFEVAFPPLE